MAKINNIAYQFADLELSLFNAADGESLTVSDAFTEANYSDNVEREKLRGAAQVALDATDGEYDAEGSIVLHQKMFRYINDWCKERGIGFYNAEFNLVFSYRKRGTPQNVDTIRKVMFGSRDSSNSSGSAALTISCDLFIKDRIFFDGVGPFGETL